MSSITVVGKQSVTSLETNPSGAGEAQAAPPSLLPDPGNLGVGGDPSAELAALLVKIGQTEKKGDDATRAAAEKAEDSAEAHQVGLMREKAATMKTAALVTGGLELGSAVAGFSAVVTSDSGPNGLVAGRAASYFQVSSKTLDAGSKFAGALFSASEQLTDASIAEADHDGQHAKRAADDAKSDGDAAQKYVDQVLDFYRQYESAASQATLAAVHRS